MRGSGTRHSVVCELELRSDLRSELPAALISSNIAANSGRKSPPIRRMSTYS